MSLDSSVFVGNNSRKILLHDIKLEMMIVLLFSTIRLFVTSKVKITNISYSLRFIRSVRGTGKVTWLLNSENLPKQIAIKSHRQF